MTVSSYLQPASLAEALAVLDDGADVLVMAGGTVTMPLVNEGISLPDRVMGLRRAGLDGLERRGNELHVGATVTLSRLAAQDDVPLLRDAARRTASWAVRNMGTVGGNLFTPPPGGDVATALLALDARVVVASTAGSREVPLAAFLTGFMTNDLRPDELVTSIVVPVTPGETSFVKFGRRHANTPAVVTVATRVVRSGGAVTEARIALGAAGPHPARATRAEAALAGTVLEASAIAEAASIAAADCDPFDDAVASAWYRRRMVEVFVARALGASGTGSEERSA